MKRLTRYVNVAGALTLAAFAITACGPKNVVPSGSDHPADPNAASGPETPVSTTLTTGERPTDSPAEVPDHDHGAMKGMDHGDMKGMDHGDMKGMDHGDAKKPAGKHDHGGGHDHSAATPPIVGEVNAAEMSAFQKAKPVFEKYCAGCHTSKATYRKKEKAMKHFAMDSYPFGGHHSQELGMTVRKVLGASGKKATMPLDDPGAVEGKELELVLAWADAFDKAHPAKAGEDHKHKH